ncbi:MAG: ABC transporter permease [Chloroflexi bacterium]|nr:ABC transporter permease [Chloroflexota bacterium]
MDTILILSGIFTIAFRSATALLYTILGEIIAERSGVMNLGLEGMLLSSAMIAFAVAYHSGSLAAGVLCAALMSALLAAIFAMLTVFLQADQVLTGLVLFIFGSGLSSFLGQRLGPGNGTLVGLAGPRFERLPIPWLSRIPVVGDLFFNQDIFFYGLFLLVPLCIYLLNRTRAGLHLRAVGENPSTADTLGIRVQWTRFVAVVAGGALVGLGGAQVALSYSPGWTDGLTSGRGWIAFALVIFSAWDPGRAVLGAVLFGGISALQFRLQAAGVAIPSAILRMLPYLFTLGTLVFISSPRFLKRAGIPAGLGRNYMRGGPA